MKSLGLIQRPELLPLASTKLDDVVCVLRITLWTVHSRHLGLRFIQSEKTVQIDQTIIETKKKLSYCINIEKGR